MCLPCDCLLDGEAVGDTLHVFDLLESGGIDHRKPCPTSTGWASWPG